MKRRGWVTVALVGLMGAAFVSQARAADDPYEAYVKTSKDFQRVKQDADWLYEAFPSWVNMPWPTGTWREMLKTLPRDWWVQHGYNGAAINRGNTDYLDFINKYKLHFYVDHLAGKYDLLLHNGTPPKSTLDRIFNADMRIKPVNDAMRTRLQGIIKGYIACYVDSTPYRSAYALDDELSWGHFVYPAMWKITDDESAYPKWLAEIYGAGHVPPRDGWTTYEAIWPRLKTWKIRDFDVSQLMDQLTFNDSYWNNFLGGLVEYANSLDPHTPTGYVGGQSPNAFGGFDYAKVMRKVQYIESYNLGGSQSVIRSLNPNLAIPAVTTHFHQSVPDTLWQLYYYVGHGNRGFIGWPDGKWWQNGKPTAMHAEVAPHYRLVNEKIGPLAARSQWVHDGVAILYNHASIQMSWIMDAECHGTTWKNRRNDHRLGTSQLVRHAWENMLRDEGLQYNHLDYATVIQDGIPKEYKVLILPAALCLSDAEARRIREFAKAGGTVIADFLPGLWDQHGRGRPEGGALDDVFDVKHDVNLTAADVFQPKLWAEVDQDDDKNYNWKTYKTLMANKNGCITHESGFNKAVRKAGVDHVNRFGQGTAVLMNLSPQWYNAHREAGFEAAKKREVFMKHVRTAGVKPWVRIAGAGEAEHGYEISYLDKAGRTIVFVCFNPEVTGTSLGGGNAAGLKTAAVDIRLKFAGPVADVRDERTGKSLGDGDTFAFKWTMCEAVILSFKGAPPR